MDMYEEIIRQTEFKNNESRERQKEILCGLYAEKKYQLSIDMEWNYDTTKLETVTKYLEQRIIAVCMEECNFYLDTDREFFKWEKLRKER